MSFTLTTTLTIRGNEYRFVADGNDIYINGTGARATVYRIMRIDTQEEFALKVFKEDYQVAYRRENYEYFQRTLPNILAFGWVQQRMLLTEQDDATLIQEFPELRNAIVMPWFDLPQVDQVRQILQRKGGNSLAQTNKCKHFGQLLADTLAQLEQLGIAHGDIASSNVLIDWDRDELYIIDIEDMYHASLEQPITTQNTRGGTGGYRFSDDFSSWQSTADRFAGALLICELLTLSSEECQEISAEESYFHQDNLDIRALDGTNDKRFAVLYEELMQVNRAACDYLKTAWLNTNLANNPTMKQWSEILGKPSLTTIFQRWITQSRQTQNSQQSLQNPAVIREYRRSADSDNPVLFVYLLDLSRSMFKFNGQDGRLRFTIALDLINTINMELLSRSRKQGGFRPRYHISVIGYNKYCYDLLSPYPYRKNGENNKINAANTRSGIHPIGSLDGWEFSRTNINSITPIGFDMTLHANGETHMTQAFKHVYDLINKNKATYQDSHPPYVFHITDGANNDNDDFVGAFNSLTSLSTNYGNTLVSTAYIGAPLIHSINKSSWTGITDDTEFIGERANHGESLRMITSRMPAAYHNKLVKIYPQLSSDSYLFFPGTDEEMLKLALTTSKSTGE